MNAKGKALVIQLTLSAQRGSTDSGAYDSSFYIPTSGPCNCSSPKIGREADGSQYVPEDCFDFPHLPVTDLFEKSGEITKSCELHDNTLSTEHKLRFEKMTECTVFKLITM